MDIFTDMSAQCRCRSCTALLLLFRLGTNEKQAHADTKGEWEGKDGMCIEWGGEPCLISSVTAVYSRSGWYQEQGIVWWGRVIVVR